MQESVLSNQRSPGGWGTVWSLNGCRKECKSSWHHSKGGEKHMGGSFFKKKVVLMLVCLSPFKLTVTARQIAEAVFGGSYSLTLFTSLIGGNTWDLGQHIHCFRRVPVLIFRFTHVSFLWKKKNRCASIWCSLKRCTPVWNEKKKAVRYSFFGLTVTVHAHGLMGGENW